MKPQTESAPFKILTTTKVGSIPFVTIDNQDKYLPFINDLLFSYRDLFGVYTPTF